MKDFKKRVKNLSKRDDAVGRACKELLNDNEFNWRWGIEKKRKYIINTNRKCIIDALIEENDRRIAENEKRINELTQVERRMEYIMRYMVTPALEGELKTDSMFKLGLAVEFTNGEFFVIGVYKDVRISLNFDNETELAFQKWLIRTYNEIIGKQGELVKL
jgi:hypothetical protein